MTPPDTAQIAATLQAARTAADRRHTAALEAARRTYNDSVLAAKRTCDHDIRAANDAADAARRGRPC